MRRLSRMGLWAWLALGLVQPASSQQIIINEIMYHPASEDVREEYIELFNAGSTNVNLSGWRISGGVDFAFPTNTTLGAGKYLVVAADLTSFNLRYPGVTNVVGSWLSFTVTNVNGRSLTNWSPILSNRRNTINLNDATGQRINEVTYADEGDWAIRQKGPLDVNERGWIWTAQHDGLGSSLELINAALRNDSGQNWASSTVPSGTPGAANSVRSSNVAPLILEARHLPLIPRSTEAVSVSARIVDESSAGLTVTLRYRTNVASPGPFASTNMVDDGMHGDVGNGDGIYGALLPPMTNNTIIEFYVEASDGQGNTRTWPAPALNAADLGGGSLGQAANAMFQVDDSTYTGPAPLHKLIITADEITQLTRIFNNNVNSDAEVNSTFINVEPTGIECRYLCGVRNRGHGSRAGTPHNYRVNFASDNPWKGVGGLNINARTVHAQVVGAILAQKSGAAGNNSRFATLRVNNGAGPGGTPGSGGLYASNEAIDSDWADRQFPNDGGGNIYAVIRDSPPPNFDYRGEDPSPYRHTYFKQSNVSEDDWEDLIGMLEVMGENQTNLFTTARARAVVNVEQWLRHLAVMNLFGNNESGLNTGNNDDYYFYRGFNDPRFIMVYHDLDSILGQGSQATSSDIFRATCCPISGDSEGSWRAMNFFMHHPEIEPLYYRTMQDLLDTTFSQPQFDALVDQVFADFPQLAGVGTSMKTWVSQRRSYVLGVIAGHVPPPSNAPVATVSGEPRSPTWRTSTTLTVGGVNIVSYQWRLNNGAWSAETSVISPISLSGLANGSSNTVYVIGKNGNGVWQSTGSPTVSRTWIVNTGIPTVRLNEILARNDSAVNHNGTFPDLIELYNEGAATVNLSGLRLTDDPADPNKFVVPAGTNLAASAYLLLYANNSDGTPGFHLGFNLSQNGHTVYLFNSVANGGALLDSVEFGLQLPDLSIGRFGSSGAWALTQPTFGSANIVQNLGSQGTLKINEWLAASQPPFTEDFIEIYNPDSLPVALGGMYLTDEPLGAPAMHRIPDLSFVTGVGYALFTADGQADAGAEHVNFRLATEQGSIGLFDAALATVDCVTYGPQRQDVSYGRCPNGALTIVAMGFATPGSPNYCPAPPPPPQAVVLVNYTNVWRYDQTSNYDGVLWTAPGYDDSFWPTGPGVLAKLNTGATIPEPIGTPLTIGRWTYYFRTSFVATNTNITSLRLTHLFDDGAVVYLNGQELPYRYNLPQSGAITYTTPGSVVSGPPTYQGPFTFPADKLLPGTNRLAVEVHQNTLNSADVVMGLKLEGLIVTNAGTGVVINEVLADNAGTTTVDGRTPDWIEFYNPSSNAVDLAGMSINDQPNNSPPRWIFPPGSIVPATGYLLIYADADLPVSSTNTGFGLKANGGSIFLFNRAPNANDIVDRVDYGIQTPDLSVGRVPSGGSNWMITLPTPGVANVAAALGDPFLLRVNEWMADPASGDDWFEIYNGDTRPVALANLRLTDTLGDPNPYRVPALSVIGTGSNAFVRFEADDPSTPAGPEHVNFKLSKDGDSIILLATNGGTQIDAVTFGRQTNGVSQGRLPDGAAGIVFFPETPTPKNPNYRPLANVVVNEVLTHTDLPLEDAIELRNTTDQQVDISGWWLSDANDAPRKYRVPTNSVLQPYGFKVFYEYQFNSDINGVPFAFSSAKGDQAYLSEATPGGLLTGYRAVAKFGPAANGVSFGRYVNSMGSVDYVAMSALTFGTSVTAQSPTNQIGLFRMGEGASNAYPLVGPIVITEIMYHPPDIIVPGVSTNDNVVEEFIELHNITANLAPLYDPNYPTNGWRLRDAVDFDFDTNHCLPPGGYLLVVSFDPLTNTAALAQFQSRYGSNLTLVGPYSGKLDNSSENIELYKPDPPQLSGDVPYVLVEHVAYTDRDPWPTNADGRGSSLQRINPILYGNEPTNWSAALPTPASSLLDDCDGDGLPNAWEWANGLKPYDPSDALQDADGDGFNNLQEFQCGTNPRDPQSYLRIDGIASGGGTALIRFRAVAGKAYSVVYRTNVASGAWVPLTNVPPQAVTQDLIVIDTNAGGNRQRYYRLLAPIPP